MTLTIEAEKIRNTPNAGGSSVVSEMMSYEMLKRVFGAQLMKTEMEVFYFPEGGAITDYTCMIRKLSMGVSVTRAMKYRGEFTMEDATKLLNKKLNGVVQSTKNSMEKWGKQILHIWATNKHVANVVIQAYDGVSENAKANTIVLITTAENCPEIFWNK